MRVMGALAIRNARARKVKDISRAQGREESAGYAHRRTRRHFPLSSVAQVSTGVQQPRFVAQRKAYLRGGVYVFFSATFFLPPSIHAVSSAGNAIRKGSPLR